MGTDLQDFAYYSPLTPDGLGNQYIGRITQYVPTLKGAFVDIGEKECGFLADEKDKTFNQEGEFVHVQIVKSAQNGKGPRLRPQAFHTSPSERSIQLIQYGATPIDTLIARYPDAPLYINSLQYLHILPTNRQSHCHVLSSSHKNPLQDQIEDLLSPIISLPNGMTASFSPTPAAIVIDMDTAQATQSHHTKLSAQYALNQQALPLIMRHIQLRNLSGAILIDLAGLPQRKRKTFAHMLTTLTNLDPLKPKFLGFSALGFAEILRPRLRPPLHELFSLPYGQTLECLCQIWKQHTHFPPSTLLTIECGKLLLTLMTDHPELSEEFYRFSGYRLSFVLSPALTGFQWKSATL
ncbi:ribonuclease E/G [Entomobacter blattae]|uniref:Ribonuclease E n=1 Tax=Entomobacter blattae TaxID=2762277 RepID=A0A7H1NS92_9PROT|nr:ribonuclease E/G [Entomobacter blattae]QNT78652.1 Ribonuclease E [Entomobacter blattae]